MVDRQLLIELLCVAEKLGLHNQPHEIDSIEKLAWAARKKGRMDVLDILREEIFYVDKAQSVYKDTGPALLYMAVAKRVKTHYGLVEFEEIPGFEL